MSAPVSRTSRPSGAALQATRQQLDELDALLQRMLNLPVSPASDGEAEPLDEERVPVRPPALARGRADAVPRYDRPPQGAMPEPPAPVPQAPTAPSPGRGYPPSYMVVETAAPPYQETASIPSYGGHPAMGPRLVSDPSTGGLPGGHNAYAGPLPPGLRHDRPHEMPAPIEPPGAAHHSSAGAEDDWVPFRSSWQPSAQTWKPLADSWQQVQGAGGGVPEAPVPPPAAPVIPPAPEYPRGPDVPRFQAETAYPAYPGGQTVRHDTPTGPVVVSRPAPFHAPVDPPYPPQGYDPRPAAPSGRIAPGPLDAPIPPPPPVVPLPTGSARPGVLAPLVWFNRAFDLALVPLGPPGRWLAGPSGRSLLGTVGLLCLAAAAALALADRIGWTG